MKSSRLNKNKIWLKLITYIVITTFLSQDIAWASTAISPYTNKSVEDKLSTKSKVIELVNEWNIISLLLAIYDMYEFRVYNGITVKKIDSVETIRRKLRYSLRKNGNLEKYSEYVNRIKDVSLEKDGLIYVKYLEGNSELLLRFYKGDKADGYTVLSESEDIISGYRLQVVVRRKKVNEETGETVRDANRVVEYWPGTDVVKLVRAYKDDGPTLIKAEDYDREGRLIRELWLIHGDGKKGKRVVSAKRRVDDNVKDEVLAKRRYLRSVDGTAFLAVEVEVKDHINGGTYIEYRDLRGNLLKRREVVLNSELLKIENGKFIYRVTNNRTRKTWLECYNEIGEKNDEDIEYWSGTEIIKKVKIYKIPGVAYRIKEYDEDGNLVRVRDYNVDDTLIREMEPIAVESTGQKNIVSESTFQGNFLERIKGNSTVFGSTVFLIIISGIGFTTAYYPIMGIILAVLLVGISGVIALLGKRSGRNISELLLAILSVIGECYRILGRFIGIISIGLLLMLSPACAPIDSAVDAGDGGEIDDTTITDDKGYSLEHTSITPPYYSNDTDFSICNGRWTILRNQYNPYRAHVEIVDTSNPTARYDIEDFLSGTGGWLAVECPPTEDRIAFLTYAVDLESDDYTTQYFHLYVVDTPDGITDVTSFSLRELTNLLTEKGHDTNIANGIPWIAWYPDGERLAISVGNRIYMINVKEEMIEELLQIGDGYVIQNLTISPDAQWLAYTYYDPDGDSAAQRVGRAAFIAIYDKGLGVFNLNNNTNIFISDPETEAYVTTIDDLHFSPDNMWLAYSLYREDTSSYSVHLHPVDDLSEFALDSDKIGDSSDTLARAKFSVDGRYLIWTQGVDSIRFVIYEIATGTTITTQPYSYLLDDIGIPYIDDYPLSYDSQDPRGRIFLPSISPEGAMVSFVAQVRLEDLISEYYTHLYRIDVYKPKEKQGALIPPILIPLRRRRGDPRKIFGTKIRRLNNALARLRKKGYNELKDITMGLSTGLTGVLGEVDLNKAWPPSPKRDAMIGYLRRAGLYHILNQLNVSTGLNSTGEEFLRKNNQGTRIYYDVSALVERDSNNNLTARIGGWNHFINKIQEINRKREAEEQLEIVLVTPWDRKTTVNAFYSLFDAEIVPHTNGNLPKGVSDIISIEALDESIKSSTLPTTGITTDAGTPFARIFSGRPILAMPNGCLSLLEQTAIVHSMATIKEPQDVMAMPMLENLFHLYKSLVPELGKGDLFRYENGILYFILPPICRDLIQKLNESVTTKITEQYA